MTKTKKILLIVGLSLLALLVIGCLVFWLLYPELSAQLVNMAWDWLNAPLPIVGVSILIVGMFAIKLVSMTSWGKAQVSKITSTNEEYKTQIGGELSLTQEKIDELVSELARKQAEIEYLKNKLVELCSTIKNKKVNELGEGIKNEETINSDTTQE